MTHMWLSLLMKTMMKATSQKYNLLRMTVNHSMIIARIHSVSL